MLGAMSAVIAFAVAAPYIDSLDRPNIPLTDPASHYSTGTQWDLIEHVVFGALLLGSFAFVIKASEHGSKRGLIAGIVGMVVGAVVEPLANSSADLLGMASERMTGGFSPLGGLFWCALVPTSIAFSMAFCLGITLQRAKRAVSASIVGFFASLACHYLIGPLLALAVVARATGGDLSFLNLLQQSSMKAAVPGWEAMDIAIGITMGLLFAYAQNNFRVGWVRLLAGRNEYRDWNLDHQVNRIGTHEGVEVPLRGQLGVAPVHAEIILQDKGFLLRDLVGGTYLNGCPVQQAWLNSGDRINVGQATLVFCSKGAQYNRIPAAAYMMQPLPWQPEPQIQPGPALSPDANVMAAPTEHRLMDGFGRVYTLASGLTTLGRDPSNTISLTWDNSVSRFHGEIRIEQSGVTFRDLGSSNGSRVNGSVVSQTPLSTGDLLEVGAVSLRFDSGVGPGGA